MTRQRRIRENRIAIAALVVVGLLMVWGLVGCASPTDLVGRADVALTIGEDSLASTVANKQITPAHAIEVVKYIDDARAAKKALVTAIASGDNNKITLAAKALSAALDAYAKNSP